MTGVEMETYLSNTIQNDDVTKFGTYNKDIDDVTLYQALAVC